MSEEVEEVDAREKVAILMIALGQEATAEVMKYMNDIEIESIAQSISELDVVTTEQEDDVLEEFEQLLIAGKYVSQGGLDFARRALEKALGPRKAQGLLDRVTSTTSSGFYMLRNVDPNQIVPYIAKEHPQTISLILSQLDPTQSAGVDLPPPMYPHPELGCGRDWWFNGYFRCGWKIAKRAVWSDVIVLVAPPLSQHFGFL